MAALAKRITPRQIKLWGAELGFQAVGIADVDLSAAGGRLAKWLGMGWHGEMDYMARHAALRSQPADLVPGTVRVLSCRMDYLADIPGTVQRELRESSQAYIARYARGRDYHKVMRGRLRKLCERIETEVGPFSHRAFADSAPVMEVELATRAGIGWRGKHTLLLDRQGSWFFLGEIYCDLDVESDAPVADHCGTCGKCIDICPTQAIVEPYQLDARRCISYLTIELKGPIPEELRPLIGNRVYGCDDCQLVCPWNGFAKTSAELDFRVRNGLDSSSLLELFAWTEEEFGRRMQGSPIRRIGYECWLRNLAVGLGNAPKSPEVISSLKAKEDHSSPLVREHVRWALEQHGVAA
jgi:epoxyqueuosine reductase